MKAKNILGIGAGLLLVSAYHLGVVKFKMMPLAVVAIAAKNDKTAEKMMAFGQANRETVDKALHISPKKSETTHTAGAGILWGLTAVAYALGAIKNAKEEASGNNNKPTVV